ncbi:MAG: hypothetical protein GX410_03975 [Elusimicrobia bacterium]|nr:hypothetical protein [Elusimicrobiota bacterium]
MAASGILLLLLALTAAAGVSASPREMLAYFPQGAYICELVLDHSVNFVMPLASCTAYWFSFLKPSLSFLAAAIPLLGIMLLMWHCAVRLASRKAAILAVLVFWFYITKNAHALLWPSNYLESLLLALNCTAIACVLLLREGNALRSTGMELLLAALIGCSFMIKSPLILLPPLLAVREMASGRLARGETSYGKLAILLFAPYAMLLPWAWMNRHLFGFTLALENGRSAQNIISGALGVVCTVEGAYPMAALPPNTPVALWAAQTVLAHPLNYAAGVLARIYTIFTWHPAVISAFVLSCLRWRRNAASNALALFALYFMGIHVLLSVEPRYLMPIYPALALCAAILPFANTGKRGPTAEIWLKTASVCAISILLAAYLTTAALLWRYAAGAVPLAKANVRHPLLLSMSAREKLSAGDIISARSDAARAVLSGGGHAAALEYMYALLAGGHEISPLFRQRLLNCRDRADECLALEAANALLAGKQPDKAKTYFAEAVQAWSFGALSFKAVTSENEAFLRERQRRLGAPIAREAILNEISRHLPAKLTAEIQSIIPAKEKAP